LTFGKSEYNKIGKLGDAQAVKRHFGREPDAFQAEFEGAQVDVESKAKRGGGK
jgi:hypothetical protein